MSKSFDPTEGERRKREAIDRVETNADERWKAAAAEVVRKVALGREEFTTDRIWGVLEREFSTLETPEPRAMGAVMRRAAKDGLIEKTDRHLPTARPEAHRRPIPVWRSLVCKLQEQRGVETINKTHTRCESSPKAGGYSGPPESEESGDESVLPAAASEERSVPSLFDADECCDWNRAA
jgi:hypothetical protein